MLLSVYIIGAKPSGSSPASNHSYYFNFIQFMLNSLLVKKFISLLVSISLVIFPVYSAHIYADIALPDIGSSASAELTPHMEEQIGRDIANQIRSSHQLIDDLELDEYLQNLGYALVANSDDAYQNFLFFLIDSRQINAFATPGGVIAVYSGLFLTTETESELASVLGHEIAHVTQRHIARSFEKANQLNIPVMAGMLAGLLLGAAGGVAGDIGAAAAIGLSAAGQQSQINYTRANEKEADRVGIRFLSLSGYDPAGMPEFFQKLERKNRYVGRNYPEFLRTHPVTVDRIAEAIQRAETYKRTVKRFRNQDSYRLMKTKLHIITSSAGSNILQQYAHKAKKSSLSLHPEYHYGYGLALLKKQKYPQAIKVLEQLHTMKPNNTSYTVALAKAYLAANKKKSSLTLLKSALANTPYNLVLTVNYAEALIKSGKLKQSVVLLNKFSENNFKHPAIFKLLSQALGKKNQLVKAHIAQSEYYYLTGQLGQAIEQLRLAQKRSSKKDFYTISKMGARKRAIEEEKEKYSMKNN
jgi:predicted Zn-dependent protease